MTEVEHAADAPEARHTATYTHDKRTGQLLVRLQGPNAWSAEGHEVPVTAKSGRVQKEKLTRLTWSGFDDFELAGRPASGERVGLYEFERAVVRDKEPFIF